MIGPCQPFSMVRMNPLMKKPHITSGYKIDSPITGFTVTGVSGTGGGGRYGNFCVYPKEGAGMTMTVWQSIIMIAAIVLATVLTRSLPFIIFGSGRSIPPFINYLGKVLPYAVTGMLVVYSLKDAPFNAWHGLPEFICVALTLALHFWRRSMLLSIAGGTLAYMFLVQKIF